MRPIVGAFTLLVGCVSLPLLAQPEQRKFMRVTCSKTPTQQSGDHSRFASAIATDVSRGGYTGGYELRSVYPGGSGAECEFRSIVMFENLGAEQGSDARIDERLKSAGRAVVRHELWRTMADIGGLRSGDRVMLTFLKLDPAKAQDWLAAETKLYMPMHNERIKRGLLRGWSIHRLVFPRGGGKEYNAVSIDVHSKMEHALGGIPEDIFKAGRAAIPEATEMIKKFAAAREILQVEVMEVVAVAGSQQ